MTCYRGEANALNSIDPPIIGVKLGCMVTRNIISNQPQAER